jgi:ABC-type transport system substrate-binding protein
MLIRHLLRGPRPLLPAGALLLLTAVLAAGDPPAPLWPRDLKSAAKNAPPAVTAVYRDLATPYDLVADDDGKQRVPLPRAGAKPEADGVTPYEEIALQKVGGLLGDKGLPAREKLRAAEDVLAAVLRFHLAARDRPLGGDNPWQPLEEGLRQKLLDVRLERLQSLASAGSPKGPAADWGAALGLADRLLGWYPDSKRARDGVAAAWARYADERLKAGDFRAAGTYQRRLERTFLHFPDDKGRRAAALRARAEALRKEARGLTDQAAAVQKLQEALEAWPHLPELRDELLKRQGAYRVLYVGVRSLPGRLSPAAAWTDPEKQAVELLFQRLVREVYDPRRGERYRPDLAEGLPEVVPGGRRMRLARDAYWWDGKHVTATDVRNTALLLKSAGSAEWRELVDPPATEGDPFRIAFRLRHGFRDPLLPLSFHVLPPQAQVGGGAAFARAPVGSGPFHYVGPENHEGRRCAVFRANPWYGGDSGRPYIREIRFYVPKDPVRDFQDAEHPLHLLLDLPTDLIPVLRKAGVKDVRTLEPRRVYILAVNHRGAGVLGKSLALRLALAHGIDREGILNSCFRGGHPADRVRAVLGAAAAVATAPLTRVSGEFHRPANGPYPPGSWACAPTERVLPLSNVEKARGLLARARDEDGVGAVRLTLKYPDDDPRVARACREIARQLKALGDRVKCPVTLKLVALAPHAFRDALARRDYDLAYHHIDFGSEAYWLWPLFDTSSEALKPGGSNYLGYAGDSELAGHFRKVMNHRDFAKVREITHDIHDRLNEKMPFIPLWQLDTHIAVHPAWRLSAGRARPADEDGPLPAELDPLVVFGGAAAWRLERR